MTARMLSGYSLFEALGRGATGTVYRAEHLRSQRIVALKSLAPELCRDAAARRIALDAPSAAQRASAVPSRAGGFVSGARRLLTPRPRRRTASGTIVA